MIGCDWWFLYSSSSHIAIVCRRDLKISIVCYGHQGLHPNLWTTHAASTDDRSASHLSVAPAMFMDGWEVTQQPYAAITWQSRTSGGKTPGHLDGCDADLENCVQVWVPKVPIPGSRRHVRSHFGSRESNGTIRMELERSMGGSCRAIAKLAALPLSVPNSWWLDPLFFLLAMGVLRHQLPLRNLCTDDSLSVVLHWSSSKFLSQASSSNQFVLLLTTQPG